MLQRVRVLILGGGVAGCSLWLALRQQTERALSRGRGPVFSATVFEQARRIEPVGAGIALGPNGLRVLDGLGLLDRLRVLGGEVSKLHVYSDKGHHLRDFDLSFASKLHGYPLLCMERAELQALLVHQVLRSDVLQPLRGEPHKPILFGRRCVLVRDVGPANGGVQVKFADGTEAFGDVVIGADGARSAVRESVWRASAGREDSKEASQGSSPVWPRYAGITSLLGVTSSVPESIRGSAYWVLGQGKIYGTWSMGRKKQYWFLTRREELEDPSASRAGSGRLEEGQWAPADALQGMDEMWNWFHPYDAHAMFSRTIRAVKVGFYELPPALRPPLVGPVPGGGGRRVAMIGDAAHPMLPTVHQGANLAVEDAAFLARALAQRCADVLDEAAPLKRSLMEENHNVPVEELSASGGSADSGIREDSMHLDGAIGAALQDYFALRSSRVERVVDMSRRTGMWQTSESPAVDFMRRCAIRWIPDSLVESSLDWVYGYTVPKDVRRHAQKA